MASNQLLSVNDSGNEIAFRSEPVRTVVGCSSPSILSKLRQMVRSEPLISVVAACSNGQDLLSACEQLYPDLLILDGRIAGPDAVTVASLVQRRYQARVILVTENLPDGVQEDSDQPELIASEFRAQPFHAECLNHKVRQTVERKATSKRCELDLASNWGRKPEGQRDRERVSAEVKSPLDNHRGGAEQRMMRKLLVRDSGVVKVVPFDDIEWVDAAGDYMCVHARGETLVMRSTLRELMEKLDADIFARIHRSTIVNIEKIVSLTPLPKGAGLLELSVGKTLKVSRNYRDAVKDLFQ